MVVQLPIELLQIIVQDAEPQSLRTYRLVDRQWCAASTPFAFSRYHASLFSRSLIKLSALAQSSLAKHVKAIEFHTDQLPNYTRNDYEAKIDLRPNISKYRASLGEQVNWSEISRMYNKLPMHNYTPAQLEKGWLAFQTYCSEQKRWIDGQAGLVLEDCLCRLQNLSEVVISKAKPFGGPLNNTPFWRNFMDEILVGPDAWTYGHSTSYQYEALSTLYIMTAIGRRISVNGIKAIEKLTLDLPDPFSFYHMIHLPPSSAGVIPKEFRERGFIGADPDQSHLASRYNVIVDVFRPLKHLALWGPSVIEDDLDGPGARSQVKETAHFLTSAINLRSLALDFGEPSHSYEGASDELELFDCSLLLLIKRSHQTYPHLEDLRISSAFQSNFFKNFLILHKDTLKRLDIRDCLCDNWDKVLKTIARDLKLDFIYVESLWSPASGDDFDEEGESFILGEGLDANDEFAQDLKAFLQTGEGSMPRIDDYEMSDSDDGHDETLYATCAMHDPMIVDGDDDEVDESLN
ncbi:hypothetical protein MBLNU13_g01643t1 [Cladosporium sp. NU13]